MIAIPSLIDPQGMGIRVIERVYPKASELSEILNYNPCPECSEVFFNTPNLEMHRQKCHGLDSGPVRTAPAHNVIKQFFCPVEGCKYSGEVNMMFGIKYFTQHKYLKQHYIKVHMEKKFVCEQCGKGFATVQQRKRHLDECGLKFACSCGAEYNTIPALLTHASRKQHTFVKSWSAVRNRKVDKNDNINNTGLLKPTPSPILPKLKLYDTMVANTAEALSELTWKKSVDIGVQTEPTGQRRRRNPRLPDTSRQTQTGEKRTRISSETQTVGEYFNKGKKNLTRRRKKSMETQTKTVEHTAVSEDSCYQKLDVGLPQLWFNSGTQTSAETLFDDSLPNFSEELFKEEPVGPAGQVDLFSNINVDSSYQLIPGFKDDMLDVCSTETQTEFSFESLFENYTDTLTTIETQTSHELWDQYSNTCTQTCDDILLMLSDTETQTAWPDVTAEIQH